MDSAAFSNELGVKVLCHGAGACPKGVDDIGHAGQGNMGLDEPSCQIDLDVAAVEPLVLDMRQGDICAILMGIGDHLQVVRNFDLVHVLQ